MPLLRDRRPRPRARLCLAAACLALLACTPAAARQTLHTEPSDYAPVVVYESDGQRCLTFDSADNLGRQTCVPVDGSPRMVLGYTRMMISALLAQPAPARVLVIGLGGGTLPSALAALVPQAHVDVVEIDPAVDRVAQAWFGFRPSARLRVHHEDGRAYVERAVREGRKYDLVLLDAFDADYIPRHLTTQEFLSQVRALLAPQGVLAANTFSSSEFYDRESATYASVFGECFNLRAGNRVIVAVNGTLPDEATLARNQARWAARLEPYGVDLERERLRYEGRLDFPAGTRVLRDGE